MINLKFKSSGLLKYFLIAFVLLICNSRVEAQTVTVFSDGFTGGNNIGGITQSSDGNVWFTKSTPSSQIGRMSASGTFTYFDTPTSGAVPLGIANGPSNEIWFAEYQTSKLGKILSDGQITEFTLNGIAGDSAPIGITFSYGFFWIPFSGLDVIARYSEGSAFTVPKYGVSAGSGPDQIISAGNNKLWFTQPNTKKISRITTDGVVTEFTFGTRAPRSIALGSDGNLWFTQDSDGANFGKIGRFSTDGTNFTEFALNSQSDPGLGGITAGKDGNLWFTERLTSKIGRITPAGVITEFDAGATNPKGIVGTNDGLVYFTSDTGIGKLKVDDCPNDTSKTTPGVCGCGFPETDSNSDIIVDCGTPRSFAKNMKPAFGLIAVGGKSANLFFEKLVGKKLSYTYEVKGPKGVKINSTTKKNTLKLKNLKAGSYKAKFKIEQATKNGAVKSKNSDTATFIIE